MIKSVKVWRGRRESVELELLTFPSLGIFLIYRNLFPNLPPISERNIIFLMINMFFLIYD